MKRLATLSIVFVFIFLLASTGVGQGQALPLQQGTCPAVATVRVQPGFALNVRGQPGGAISGNAVTGKVTFESGEMKVVEERTVNGEGYLRLASGGWIWNRYLSITCATPTARPSSIATPALTPPIGGLTPTKVSTPAGKVVWVCWRGVCQECPLPCQVEIRERP